jgi:Fe-S-cluster-containing dehydrogenase component
MGLNRRRFLRWGLGAAAATPIATVAAKFLAQDAAASAIPAAPVSGHAGSPPLKTASPAPAVEHVGCLADTTLCIGCRKCEEACNRRNKLPRPEVPFTDKTVFRRERRPVDKAFTVVNEYAGAPSPDQASQKQTYAKVQCLHCLTPSCVSACIVGAMVKAPDGAIVYNPKVCLGCRYCMVACPFQIPAYEYDVTLDPRVRKCEFCASFAGGTGADPACAAACPTEALVFGKRAALLALAKDRVEKRPDRYVNHVYGENEVGGTSWLYLTGRPGTEIGLIDLPSSAPAKRTESIQHGIFKYGIIPITIYGALGAVMWFNQRKAETNPKSAAPDQAAKKDGSHE